MTDKLKADASPLPLAPEVPVGLLQAWPYSLWSDVHVAVAISGGCDSIALLRALLELKHRHGGAGRVVALHVNHHLRGDESEADAVWCRRQCESLQVPITILNGDVSARAEAEGDGIEAAARKLRYELLTQAAEQCGSRYLATAHSRDDLIETLLFRMLRGSGLQGLRGIPFKRQLSTVVTLVRPLLGCSRNSLESYLHDIGQTYRTDSSNQDSQFSRNQIRNKLLPMLRAEYNPEVDAALLRLASQADEAQEYIESQAQVLLSKTLGRPVAPSLSCQELAFALEPFTQANNIMVCEALRLAWRQASLPEQSMTYDWWRKLAGLARNPSVGSTLNLPGGVQASIAAGRLLLKW
ncbi:MAG: tRNA lysidine(34) synthetase TilS [Planctomycetales bacterium]|nr:tRNA lysidine(34) synthetase TilS [Planctomycetales bacterium]